MKGRTPPWRRSSGQGTQGPGESYPALVNQPKNYLGTPFHAFLGYLGQFLGNIYDIYDIFWHYLGFLGHLFGKN